MRTTVIVNRCARYLRDHGPLLAALRAGSAAGGDRACGSEPKDAAVVVLGATAARRDPAARAATGASSEGLAA